MYMVPPKGHCQRPVSAVMAMFREKDLYINPIYELYLALCCYELLILYIELNLGC